MAGLLALVAPPTWPFWARVGAGIAQVVRGLMTQAPAAGVGAAVGVASLPGSTPIQQAQTGAQARDQAGTDTCTTQKCACKRDLYIRSSMSPHAAQHILDAQRAGYPSTLTYEPLGAQARGRAAVRGTPTLKSMDRDEYPPKTVLEGGAGASIRHIPLGDNRSAGGQMASQLDDVPPGCKITIKVIP